MDTASSLGLRVLGVLGGGVPADGENFIGLKTVECIDVGVYT